MNDAPEFKISPRDLIGCGFCARGQKKWFESNGLDFGDFLTNGITAERLLSTGDGLAVKAVEMLRDRRGF